MQICLRLITVDCIAIGDINYLCLVALVINETGENVFIFLNMFLLRRHPTVLHDKKYITKNLFFKLQMVQLL